MITSIKRLNPEFAKFLDKMNEKTGWSPVRFTDLLAREQVILEKLVKDEKFNKLVYQIYKQLYENK